MQPLKCRLGNKTMQMYFYIKVSLCVVLQNQLAYLYWWPREEWGRKNPENQSRTKSRERFFFDGWSTLLHLLLIRTENSVLPLSCPSICLDYGWCRDIHWSGVGGGGAGGNEREREGKRREKMSALRKSFSNINKEKKQFQAIWSRATLCVIIAMLRS